MPETSGMPAAPQVREPEWKSESKSQAEAEAERRGGLADFGHRWAEAERLGDVAALDALLTDDFTAVGPRGFVLGKAQWLDRYASGALVHDDFTWDEVTLRQYGRTAVAVGVQGQQSVFDGRDADGRFRITQTIVEVDGRWQLAAVHLSPTGA
ncbi:nuclear transport factor 2 family protein [Streptomyces sp. NPDC088194]|uniref:nuclear transport factor 2 family protein n=1 Tax=Streptomyces sp. NPDC088194 TaxID=3154931 RepID=UPI00344FD415